MNNSQRKSNFSPQLFSQMKSTMKQWQMKIDTNLTIPLLPNVRKKTPLTGIPSDLKESVMTPKRKIVNFNLSSLPTVSPFLPKAT